MVTTEPTDEQVDVYHNQTAVLTWLHSLGHEVDYVRDPAVPSLHLPPRRLFLGRPCPYCAVAMTKHGPRAVTRDHRHPRSRGGRLTFANRVICCQKCNGDKADLDLSQWHFRLWAARDPRADRVHAILMTRLPPP